MDRRKKIYFFGQTPLPGVEHLPLQTSRYIDPRCDLAQYDFIIVTSKRAIKAMLSFSYDFGTIPFFCIGSKTADYAKAIGLKVLHVSQGYAKNLIGEIKPMIKDKKGLYLRPKTVANSYITEEVKRGKLDQAICYETICADTAEKSIEHPAILLFAAPSQVECYLRYFAFEKEDTAVAIGTTTLKALPAGVTSVTCDEPTLESLIGKARTLG